MINLARLPGNFQNHVGRTKFITKNAVYVVEVTAVDDMKTTGDFTQQKANIVRQASSAANGQSYNALKEDADVIDNRSDFY